MSTSCCYRCIISASKLRALGLDDYINNEAIEYWGGFGINKIVMSPCSNGDVVSCYCFYPAEFNDLRQDGWNISASPQQLLDTFPDLDPRMKTLMLNAEDIKMWRRRLRLIHLSDLPTDDNSVHASTLPILGQRESVSFRRCWWV